MIIELIYWAIVPLRIILGILYIIHGFPKLKSPERTATQFLKLKIPMPKLSAIIVAILEYFGGIALILGFLTRIVAALLAIQMLVAAFQKIRTKGKMGEGYEVDLLLAAFLALLVIFGAGNFSVDNTFGWLLG